MGIGRCRSLVVCLMSVAVVVGCGGGGGGGGGEGGGPTHPGTPTTRLSVSTAGVQANGDSDYTTIAEVEARVLLPARDLR